MTTQASLPGTQPMTATVSAALTRDQIRAAFLANGFTIKEGQTDLKPYVYDAAAALLALAAHVQAAPKLTDEQRLASVQARLEARGVRGIHFAWNEGARDKGKEAVTRAVIEGLEKLLDGDFTVVQAIGDAPVPATPAEVVANEAGKGIFSEFNACMFRKECRARAVIAPAPAPDPFNASQSFEMYQLVVRQNGSLLKQIEVLEDRLAAAREQATPAEQVERIAHLRAQRDRRIYIAGPMTGIEAFNFPAFNAKAAELRAEGWHVENPAEHGHVAGAVWADYLRWDITRLATCDAIYLLPDWRESVGASLEAHIARTLRMQFLGDSHDIEASIRTGIPLDRVADFVKDGKPVHSLDEIIALLSADPAPGVVDLIEKMRAKFDKKAPE